MTDAARSGKVFAAVRLTHNSRIFEVGEEIVDQAEQVIERLLERGEASRTRPKIDEQ